ncbi:MAG TPA: DUF1684 domain-containing protein [Vicinamibacteria bacterium]|nr:DUF1684 domain-containing protein [Vicinamibacteria bacterium]
MTRIVLGLALATAVTSGSYVAEVEAWRQKREERLKADGGWLSVEGLFWLERGETSFGSDKGNGIVLPASVSPRAGVVILTSSAETRFRLAPGVSATMAGQAVTEGVLRPDSDDVLVLGPVTIQVIDRGGRKAIRMKDQDSARRRGFKGLRWYPVRERFRLAARWVPYATPKNIDIASITGQVDPMPSPGYAEFELGGKTLRLEPVLEEPGASQLFFIFKDQTAPKETYGAGRFLYAAPPADGKVELDFNKAYSPPCAFTPYATCPLPPKQNRLPVRIEAGELDPHVLH